MTGQRVAIIGAGSSGIPVIKAMVDRGLDVVCFESSDRVGGNWVFGNKNGMSSAYRSLHINTSRDRMAYADLPMPADYPDFPHHSLIARYFEHYVDHFGLRPLIRFQTPVVKAERRVEGGWLLVTEGGQQEHFDFLCVANGHHWDPRWPDPPFEGVFHGEQRHSHHYVDNQDLRGKKVLVLGMGNSAMDIAVEASQVAARTYLSMRRGAHIVPKYLFGRPLDTFITIPWLPLPVKEWMVSTAHRLAVGTMDRYGLPLPQHGILQAHPTISSDIFIRLGSGDVQVRPNIRRLAGERVEFEDGRVDEVDVIIYCTGYHVSFPFFDRDFLSAPDNKLPLFMRVFKPGLPDLAFIGLLQPLGAIMPLAEAQGQWVASYLAGEYLRPDPGEEERMMWAEHEAMTRRYVGSPRHTMQVDFDEYLAAIRQERARGEQRAKRRRRTV